MQNVYRRRFSVWWEKLMCVSVCACVHAKSLQSCFTLWGAIYHSPQGSSVHEIIQARILEWVAMPFFRGSSTPRDRTHVSCASCIGRQVLYHWHNLGSPFYILQDCFLLHPGKYKAVSCTWQEEKKMLSPITEKVPTHQEGL